MGSEQMPWSDESQELTRRHCREKTYSVGNPEGVCFKHFDGEHGVISINNALEDKWLMVVRESGDQIEFDSIEELISSGWVLD
jgi:hypothetical protein